MRSRRNLRRPNTGRACIFCRNMKTRCILLPGVESCEACLKRSRPCVMPGPAKPRLKASQKFSELEKKIELLTNALAAKPQPNPGNPQALETTIASPESTAPLTTESLDSSSPLQINHPGYKHGPLRLQPSSGRENRSAAQPRDIVDRGIIDIPTGDLLFNHWNLTMRPILPIVWLPPGTTAGHVRDTTHLLYMAILAVASASILPSFEPTLVTELNEELARRILIRGERSIKLIQAALLYSHYYIRPEGSQNFAYTQYASAAMAMSCDLALAKRATQASQPVAGRKEAARTWLAAWYTGSR